MRIAPSIRRKPHCIFLNSLLYDQIVKKGIYDYAAVRRWTTEEVVLMAHKIFIPVNITDAHWFMAVVVLAAGVPELFDSMGRTQEKMGNHIARWAKMQAAEHGLPNKDWRVDATPCRVQENCDDCGVCMCRHMELMSEGESAVGWGGSSSYLRRQIAAELLSGSLQNTSCFLSLYSYRYLALHEHDSIYLFLFAPWWDDG